MHTLARCVLLLLALSLMGCRGERGAYDNQSPEELTKLLDSPDPAVQSEVAYHLGQLGPAAKPAVPALIRVLKSPDPAAQQNAALALGLIGPDARDAVSDLIQALNDPDYGVRQRAAEALGRIGPGASSAIPALEHLSRESDVCDSAREALEKIRR